MIYGTRFLFGMFVLVALATAASAQPHGPATAKSPTSAELDRHALDVLRDVHNRGADLYNRGDPGSCYRLYEGALLTVRPFLAHHPAVQKVIDDGLAEVAKSDALKFQAFRLHEVIEDVRSRLKVELKLAGPPGALPTPKDRPGQEPSAGLSGTVTLDGKPASGAGLTIVTLGQSLPRVFSTTVGMDGTFLFPAGLPAGRYVVLVTPSPAAKVPEKYHTTGNSGLTIEVKGQADPVQLNLSTR